MLVVNGSSSKSGGNDTVQMQFNGITTGTYSDTYLFNTAGSTTAGAGGDPSASQAVVGVMSGSTSFALGGGPTVTINGYANTTFIKTFTSISSFNFQTSGLSTENLTCSGLWSGTAAITSIKIFLLSAANFVTGTTVTLYGMQ